MATTTTTTTTTTTMTTPEQQYKQKDYRKTAANSEVCKQEIQAAIAKAVELRALHAALLQTNSPAHLRLPAVSPVSRHASQLSAQDYPVFTPVSFSFIFLFLFAVNCT